MARMRFNRWLSSSSLSRRFFEEDLRGSGSVAIVSDGRVGALGGEASTYRGQNLVMLWRRVRVAALNPLKIPIDKRAARRGCVSLAHVGGARCLKQRPCSRFFGVRKSDRHEDGAGSVALEDSYLGRASGFGAQQRNGANR